MKTIIIIISLVAVGTLFQGCTIVKPGQLGVDVHFGKLQPRVLSPGPHHALMPLGRKVAIFNTREVNYSTSIDFHTKEGIDVKSDITILYHLSVDSVLSVYKKFGENYRDILIQDNIVTALRQTGLGYKATDLITQRGAIESAVKDRLDEKIGVNGFVIHSVLLKQIDLPAEIEQTIRAQLNAEESAKKIKLENEVAREQLAFQLEKSNREKQQDLQNQRLQLDFNIERQKKENERILLEADALRKQQQIINETLTDRLLKFKALEISKELVKSNNSKVIVTDGKTPLLFDDK